MEKKLSSPHAKFRLSTALRSNFFLALSSSVLFALPFSIAQATTISTWTVVVNNNDSVQDSTAKFFSYNAPSINDAGIVVFRARAMTLHGEEQNDTNSAETATILTEEDGYTEDNFTEKDKHSGKGGHSGGCGMEIGAQPSSSSESEMIHGIFTWNPSASAGPLTIAAKGDRVPVPNNMKNQQAGTFNSFPSFPRIDASSNTQALLAFRAQSKPTYKEGEDEPSGTSGLYIDTSNGSNLSTAIRNILPIADFDQYFVPGQAEKIRFEQFPGSPSPTGSIITFKGNWNDPTPDDPDSPGMTGVYYRDVAGDASGNPSKVVKIAERGDVIPDAALLGGVNEENSVLFGSTAPPSAASGKVVFTGLNQEGNLVGRRVLDDEGNDLYEDGKPVREEGFLVTEDPATAGGIFMADLMPGSELTTVAGFNTEVPHQDTTTYLNTFGESLSFDGRYVGFWAGWGEETITSTVWCTSDGKSDVVADCMSGSIIKRDENGNVITDTNGDAVRTGMYDIEVNKNQGIFLADTEDEKLFLVAQTGDLFEDFLFWNYSGNPEKGEGARWRSSAFLAVDDNNIIFKALSTSGEAGLYGAFNVSEMFQYNDIITIVETGMSGSLLDPNGTGMTITALSIERDGFRNGRFAIAAGMENADTSLAGIYTARAPVPEPGTMTLFVFGLGGLSFWLRKRTVH